MKLKSAGLVIAGVIAMTSANANANLLFDVYAGATGGIGMATTFADGHAHTDNSQSLGAMAGIDLPFVRVEGEYNFLDDQDVKLHLAMANAYLKMPSLLLQPYIGAGVGMTFGGNAPHGHSIDSGTAYQGMLGLTFDVPVAPIKIDGEARVLYAPNIYETFDDVKPDMLHYDLRVKLRYVF